MRFARSLLLLVVFVFSLGLGRVGFEGKVPPDTDFDIKKKLFKNCLFLAAFKRDGLVSQLHSSTRRCGAHLAP